MIKKIIGAITVSGADILNCELPLIRTKDTV